MVLMFLLKELISVKLAKKSYKQRYQQFKASGASPAVTPITKGDVTVTNHTPVLSTATVATAFERT